MKSNENINVINLKNRLIFIKQLYILKKDSYLMEHKYAF